MDLHTLLGNAGRTAPRPITFSRTVRNTETDLANWRVVILGIACKRDPPLQLCHGEDWGEGRSRANYSTGPPLALRPSDSCYFNAERISALASGVSHSAGPTMRPISRPSASISSVAGRPIALSVAAMRALGSESTARLRTLT